MTTPNNALAIRETSSLAPIDPRREALMLDPFEPQTMPQLMDFADKISGTPFAPKEFQGKPNDCFIAMLYGRSLALGALQSLQGIAVINGKPAVYGETFWAVVISHPDFVDCEEDVTDERAQVVLTRRNRKAYTATFSMGDAKVAGLQGKSGPWMNYPKGQMLWRARHRAATALFADALKGILPAEVARDYDGGPTIDAPRDDYSRAAAAPDPAPRGEQEKPADKPKDPLDEVVSQEQVAQWNNELKAAGFKVPDKRAELARLGVARSGEMTVRQWKNSLEYAKKGVPAMPDPAGSGAKENPPKAADEPQRANDATEAGVSTAEVSSVDPTEALAREWMNGLRMSMFQQDTLIKRFTRDGGSIDWVKVAQEIEPDAVRAGLVQE